MTGYPLFRVAALVAGIIAVVLGLVVVIGHPADSVHLLGWAAVSAGSGVVFAVLPAPAHLP